MKRAANIFVFVVSVGALAGCATHAGDVDSESHFQCSEDGDCKNAYGRSVCESGLCEFPGSRLTVLNESPGTAADCMTEWPATTLRFETVETEAADIAFRGAYGPRLNKNGTAVFWLTSPADSPQESNGHLIRWAGNTVSRFEQPVEEALIPAAVSCDGLTVFGVAYRWNAADGFAPFPGASGQPPAGFISPMAVGPGGSTVWGTYGVSAGYVAVRWENDVTESLFTLDEAADPNPGWSGDGRVFSGSTDGAPFVRTAGEPPTYLETPVEFDGRSATAISFDGNVVAGTCNYTKSDGRSIVRGYVWSSENQLEHLPEAATVRAVTSAGVAVGGMEWPESSYDYDLVWDRRNGARHLRDVLEEQGLQMPPSTMIEKCTDISADGRVITGISVDDTGTNIFRAILPDGAFD